MNIEQGEIDWIDLGKPQGSELGFIRPYVVLQNDLLNLLLDSVAIYVKKK